MLTSISTGLPVLVMLLFGGEALQDFSLALLIGIIFGTYSSVYIASPIMMLLQPKQHCIRSSELEGHEINFISPRFYLICFEIY